jgi:hypothetical protein
MDRSGKYVSITPPGEQSTVVKVPGFSLVPVFEEWENKVFARFLEDFWAKWGITYDEIYFPPDSIMKVYGVGNIVDALGVNHCPRARGGSSIY